MSRNFELLRQSNKNSTLDLAERAMPSREAPAQWEESFDGSVASANVDWLHLLKALKRHWLLSASFAAAVFITVTVATLLMKPVYESVSRIEIDPPGEDALSLEKGSGVNEAEYMETIAQNLQSDGLALAVIRALRLDRNTGELSQANVQDISENTDRNSAESRLSSAEYVALRNFRSHLKVKRDTASRLVNVSFESHDPVVAASVVNTLLQLFIERSYRTRLEAINQSSEWLSRQLDDVRKKMEDSNRALSQFQGTSGIADIDENKNTFSEQLGELNRQKAQAQTERIRLESLLRNIHDASPDMLPEVHTNQVIQNLTQKLAECRAELSQSLVIYGSNHPNVKKLRRQAEELETQINNQRSSILSELRHSFASTRVREQAISTEMRKTTKELNQLGRYSDLKREAKATADLYNTLYGRIKEAGIAAGSKSTGIRIVDPARILEKPTRPNRALNIALGLIAGLVGGVAMAFFKDRVDNRIHNPEDIMRLSTSSPISIIPVIGSSNGFGEDGKWHNSLILRKRDAGQIPNKFLLERPRSPEAEALRGLQTSLMLSRLGRPPQVMLVTSSFPAEGKTTLAVNLALALAQSGPTCLVEADLRKPGVSGTFGIAAITGLSDLLAGSATLEQILVGSPDIPNLTVLPAGPVSSNPQLVCSEAMHEIIRRLRKSFTFVVVDSPPILPYAEGRALSTFVDGVVFVGRSGMTTREAIQRSMSLLSAIHAAPILEVVLNAAEFVSPEYQYYG